MKSSVIKGTCVGLYACSAAVAPALGFKGELMVVVCCCCCWLLAGWFVSWKEEEEEEVEM